MNFQIGFALDGSLTNVTLSSFHLEMNSLNMADKVGSRTESFQAFDANHFLFPVYRLNMLTKVVIVTCWVSTFLAVVYFVSA